MLNYKTSSLGLVGVLIVMASIGIVHDIPLPFFLVPVFIYIGLLVWGSSQIYSGYFMEVYCHGDESIPEVAITFDDGPDPEFTPSILDILKQHQTTATFFCIGEKINENPEILKRISAEGHLVGNHSFSHHVFFDFFTQNNMVREIRTTNRAVEKLIQKRMFFFRPPYGVTTPVLNKAVKLSKVIPVGWSLRTLDTISRDPDKLIKKVKDNLREGDIILLHDTGRVTAEALPGIIHNIREKGFKIVRVDELLKLHAYT